MALYVQCSLNRNKVLVALKVLTVIYSLFLVVDANPVIKSFEDQWNYKITPDKTPLLSSESKIHVLPPPAKRKGKEEPEPLNVMKKMALGNSSAPSGDSIRSWIPCSGCKLVAAILQGDSRSGKPFGEIKSKIVSLCVTFKIESEKICSGFFDIFGPEIIPVLNMTQIGPPEICSMLLGESCGVVENPLHNWNVTFAGSVKPLVKKTPLPNPSNTLKVLHISDTHLDPLYEEGSVANCQEPLCCRSYSTPPDVADIIPAGKWGSYMKCDSPKILLDSMLKSIARDHDDIDYIIWTGDLPPHDIWNQTKNQSVEILKETVEQMKENFPNIPIFPALGNHEGIPSGSFPPPWMEDTKHSISWLYTEVAQQWSEWLPESVNNTLFHGGFYSVLIRPGFRIISLNMNYCHSLSWWLFVNSTDPAKELQWLIYELQEAESNNEKVHIIGHVPPGNSDCMKTWSRNFYDIVNRYESTIVAQFYGHTHSDEFEVFYDTRKPDRPTNIAFIGPSVTTFRNNNPAYRIYHVDGDHDDTTWEVIDHETWITDLEKANLDEVNDPKWFKLYSAREAYGMLTLRPEEWNNLIAKMAINNNLFETFYKFYYRDSPSQPACDDKCKLQILCDLKSGKSQERKTFCSELESLFSN